MFSTAVTLNGDLYTWGSGQNGQLGLGVLPSNNDCRSEPTKLDFAKHTQIIEIICGESYMIA